MTPTDTEPVVVGSYYSGRLKLLARLVEQNLMEEEGYMCWLAESDGKRARFGSRYCPQVL